MQLSLRQHSLVASLAWLRSSDMNISSVIMGAALLGVTAPSVLQMSIAPVEAQARARNFSEAESAAVTFAGSNEGQVDLVGNVPENCTLSDEMAGRSYDVTCTGGPEDSKYQQTVSRSFRLQPESVGSYTNPDRQFAFDTPKEYSHVECAVNDPWGVMWYNDHLAAGHLDACQPPVLRSKEAYLESNPDDWLYDISDHGYGRHPDF